MRAWAGENLTIQAELPLPGGTKSAVSFFFCGTIDAGRRSMVVSAEYTTVFPCAFVSAVEISRRVVISSQKVLGPLPITHTCR